MERRSTSGNSNFDLKRIYFIRLPGFLKGIFRMAEINRAKSILVGNVGASLPKRRATSILAGNVDVFV